MVWMLTAECEQYGVATDSSVAADMRVWLLTAQCGCQKCGCREYCVNVGITMRMLTAQCRC